MGAIPGLPGARAPDEERCAAEAVGDEMERFRISDLDRDDVAGARNLAVRRHLEVHEPRVFGAARKPVGGRVFLAFRAHHDLDRSAHVGEVLLPRNPILQSSESFVTLLDYRFRYLIRHRCSGCPRAHRVLKRERGGEPCLFDDTEGFGEIGFRFTRKPDDDVGGNRGIGDLSAHPVENPQELLTAVAAPHRLQYAIGS